jgi:hypothetical protein
MNFLGKAHGLAARDTLSNLVPPATSLRLWSVSSPAEPFSMLHLLQEPRLGTRSPTLTFFSARP